MFRAFPSLTNLPIPAFRAQSAIKQSAQTIGEGIIEERHKMGEDVLLGKNDLFRVLMRMDKDADRQGLLDQVSPRFLKSHTISNLNITYPFRSQPLW